MATEEILTWDQIYRSLARAAGAADIALAHVPSESIAALYPDLGTPLLGDLAYSAV